MRMRRKKNLEARLEACGDYILYLDRDEKNFQDKSNKQLIDFEKIFGNSNPLVLEIGCGKGQFAREIAKRNPDKNFLAVEKSSNVIVDAAQMAIDEGIPNLRFARGEAEYLDCFIPEKSVECIYLNFSCPYPKNTYARHRLTYRAFLEIYRRILVDKGEIYQKTTICTFLSSPWRSSLRQITDLKTFLSTFTTAASRAISKRNMRRNSQIWVCLSTDWRRS